MRRQCAKFDTPLCRVIVSGRIETKNALFVHVSVRVPRLAGRIGKAGETPARSRHCNENDAELSIL
jgi:hypothetical protein